jgi:hypothetical protein
MASNIRVINLIGDIKYIGDIIQLKDKVVTMKNPVEVEWIESERGLVIRVDNPIKDSSSVYLEIQTNNIVSSYEPSIELKTYYELVIPKVQEQRDEAVKYLSILTEAVATRLLDESLTDSIQSGKMTQPGSSRLM